MESSIVEKVQERLKCFKDLETELLRAHLVVMDRENAVYALQDIDPEMYEKVQRDYWRIRGQIKSVCTDLEYLNRTLDEWKQ